MDLDASTKFIGSLTKFLQSLCNGYVEFQKGVELVGHIYLSIDTGEKVDYVLHEKVNKSDENSVTFVSNSFHAMPPDKEKGKSEPSKANAVSKNINNISDDDDIVILDSGASRSSIGSTNSGTIPSRKRSGSPDQRQMHKHVKTAAGQSSIGRGVGSSRHHSGVPSATVSSQGLDINELKLEQISNDELLSLASQVGEGHSRPSVPRSQARRSGASAVGGAGDATAWIKQEAPDNPGGDADSGWSQGRDESNSNSGSNLYPVMLHTNTAAAYSNPPVFPGTSFANPMPGTSQDVSGLDPSVIQVPMIDQCLEYYHEESVRRHGQGGWLAASPQVTPAFVAAPANETTVSRHRLFTQRLKQTPENYRRFRKSRSDIDRRYWERLKQDPERYQRRKEKARESKRQSRMRIAERMRKQKECPTNKPPVD